MVWQSNRAISANYAHKLHYLIVIKAVALTPHSLELFLVPLISNFCLLEFQITLIPFLCEAAPNSLKLLPWRSSLRDAARWRKPLVEKAVR